MKKNIAQWKILGIEYARDGDITVAMAFGKTIYASIGKSIYILGLFGEIT